MHMVKQVKRVITVLIAMIFVIGSVMMAGSMANAEEKSKSASVDNAKAKVTKSVAKETKKAKKKIKPSDKKGKYFYKKTCKVCHGKKGKGGELTPMSKTIKQWERFFKKDKHTKKKLSEEFDEVQLIHIKAFLINHAADSDQPETCG